LACGAIALAAASNMLATKAWSQAIHADNPAPAGQTYLTGDWGGLRSYLERNGVTLTLTNTTDFLANVSGGIKTGAVGLGAVQPQLDLDLQKLAGWQGGLVHVHGLITYGPLFSANYLGNILAVSNIEAGPMARLYAFWYEQNGSNDLWSVRVGLMLADSQFLQSKTAANFINNGISWPDFLSANLPASGPAYPLPAPGVRVRLKPRDDMQFQAAVFSGDPSGGNGSNAASDRDGVQFQRRRFLHRRGELPSQSEQGRPRASGRLPRRRLVSHQRAFRRSALRRYRPLAGKSAIDRHCDGACRRWRRLWRDRPDALSRSGHRRPKAFRDLCAPAASPKTAT
jgi:carbohydrate-selective porin OprB